MKNTFLFIFIVNCLLSYAQDNAIELPITVQDGYGPFERVRFGVISFDLNNETDLQIAGIPDGWEEIQTGEIETNIYQATYQDYLQGNISQEMYEKRQQGWDWVPDTSTLSETPIKTKIALTLGKDINGETKVVVDANNNRDFSDDLVFTPLDSDSLDSCSNRDSLAMANAVVITYERLSEGKTVQEKAPLFVTYHNKYNFYLYNFPQYATAYLRGEEIVIFSDGGTMLSYNRPNLVLMNDSLKNGKKINLEESILINEYLVVRDEAYKNKGVNRNKNVLILEKSNLPQEQLYSTQIGFKTQPFEEQDFQTGATLSLDNYKGKYLLIDFWAVWCAPCIQEFPHLKAMYEKLDKSQFEIIGIVGDSPADRLRETIEKHDITWSQILSDETNKITQNYGINSYPTTLLIDPEGIIVAKNLRGEELEEKINELIGVKK